MLLAAPAFAEDRFEKTMSGTVNYPGGRVTIEHRFGRGRIGQVVFCLNSLPKTLENPFAKRFQTADPTL